MINALIAKLQQDLELKGLHEDSGIYSIAFDDITISISDVSHGIELSATLGNIPEELPELFFAKMLRANLFGQATLGSILGLDENGARLVLHALINDKKTPYQQFKEKVEDFMNAIDFWKKEIILHQRDPNAE